MYGLRKVKLKIKWPDVTEIHARLLDHRPILQGHINYCVQEFEDKRKHREQERLGKVHENVREMNEKIIPESLDAMEVFLSDASAKVKVAAEMCIKIEEGEIFENKELLENRKSRKNRWDEFLQGQYQNCDEIDKDFNEQVERLKTHYDELEDKLGYSTKTLHD